MSAKIKRLSLMAGLEISVHTRDEPVVSAMILLVPDTTAVVGGRGHGYDLDVILSFDCLETLLRTGDAPLGIMPGPIDEDGVARIGVQAADLCGRIASYVRHVDRPNVGETLYLQGKVLELLARGMADLMPDGTSGLLARPGSPPSSSG